VNADDWCFFPAHELLRLIRTRKISAQELTRAYLSRIERVNPTINAIVTLLPEQALTVAMAIDKRIARGDPVGSLAGLPVAHKDLTQTKGIRTTFGSPIFKDFVPDVDAVIVQRYREADAITLGKTNTPEFGAGSQTFNPVFGADGTDLGGSLRNPASFCNVVGLRPSAGRIPQWPLHAAWFALAVAGPMARTVQDIALQMSALAGPDPRSPISIDQSPALFTQSLARNWKGVRVAFSPDLGGLPMEPEALRASRSAVAILEGLGCVVEEACPDLTDADEIFHTLRAWYFELAYGALLKTHRHLMKDTVIWNIEQGARLSGPQVAAAEQRRTQLFHRMREFMDNYDFLVAPVVQVLPFDVSTPYPAEINGTAMSSYVDWMKSCSRITVTGAPALAVPGGFSSSGLPVGVQIIGRHWDDWGVLQLGHAFEEATGFWKRRPI
jgi:amidase